MKIVYFFDVISPYTAFSTAILQRYQVKWGFELVYKPILLGGLLKLSGNRAPGVVPAKWTHLKDDVAKLSKFNKVEMLQIPSNFFEAAKDAKLFQRALISLQHQNINLDRPATVFTHAVFNDPSNRTSDNKLTIDVPFVEKCLQHLELDKKLKTVILDSLEAPNIKSELINNTHEALEAGSFGSPTMLISSPNHDPALVFGCDRFELVAHMFEMPYLGPVPNSPHDAS